MKLDMGINLGGFLSQCNHEESHYDTFITKDDIKNIAKMGFDHVRLPVDYNVFEEENGTDKESGYKRVEDTILWCKEYHLNLILDLHKAYGYDFNFAGDAEKNNLFSSKPLQVRFVRLWEKLAHRFGTYPNVAFELLNEVVEKENADSWNQLIKVSVEAIRNINKTAPIIYGGIQWNSVKTMKLLEKPHDENIIFTFHFYEPLLFTHQKASWVPTIDQNQTIHYPDTMEFYQKESVKIGYQGEVVTKAKSKTMGEEFILEMVEEAIDAAGKAGASLYCGEFGVIDEAPAEDSLRWYEDVNKVFKKYHIGFSAWSYKEMNFGLIGEHYVPIRDRLLALWKEK